MFRQQIHVSSGSGIGTAFSYTPGLILVLLGILVMVMPQLLVMFVSFSLISIGITMLIMANRWRSVMKSGFSQSRGQQDVWEIN